MRYVISYKKYTFHSYEHSCWDNYYTSYVVHDKATAERDIERLKEQPNDYRDVFLAVEVTEV